MEAKIAELIEAIRAETAAQQASLADWGLTELGQRAVLKAHNHMLTATAADWMVFERYRTDIAARLGARLANLKAIPNTVREQLQLASDANWLQLWMGEAENQPITLLEEIFPAHAGTWVN